MEKRSTMEGTARTGTERSASRKGKRGVGFGGTLAWRIKYRYDNRT